MIFREDEGQNSCDQNEEIVEIKKKKKDKDEGGNLSDSEDTWKKCGKNIEERKHQKEGRHLTTCYKCYKKKKEEINREKDKDDQQTRNKK